VDFRTATFALQVLNHICPDETPVPSIVPGASGDLQIEWHLANSDVELDVRAPYQVHAWRWVAGHDEEGEERSLSSDFTDIAGWIADLRGPSGAAVAAAA
jgi:hypothetical protein